MCKLLSVFLFLLIISCSDVPKRVHDSIILAGENGDELMSVIDHYTNVDKDIEKLQATYFLLDNMKWHFSFDTQISDRYYAKLKTLLDRDSFPAGKDIKAVWNAMATENNVYVSDLSFIGADYLIRNIDKAFELWRNNFWSSHIDFNEFCETLLPYKLLDLQVVDNWKDTLAIRYKIYDEDIDTKPHGEFEFSVFHIAKQLNEKILGSVKTRFEDNYNVRMFLNDDVLTRIPYGDCETSAFAHVAAFLSKGVGAYIEYVPYWGDRDNGHAFYSIITKSGITVPVLFGVVSHGGFETMQGMNCPKVFRRKFSVNHRYLEYQQKYSRIHDFISYLFCEDVTKLYNHADNLKVEVDTKLCVENVAYICVYNNRDWRVVDFGSINKGVAEFENMGKGIVYMVYGVDENCELVPISDPFIFNVNGEIETLKPDFNKVDIVSLRRKYLKSDHVWQMEKLVVGGEIHASNNSDFVPYDVIYKISDINYPDLIKVNDAKEYRYWRYYSAPNARCNISEFQLFDDIGNVVVGKPIVRFGCVDTNYRAENVFDNDWLTCYEADVKSDCWVGCDLEKPQSIANIRVVQRSDDNGIHPGDEYALMFWNNNEWEVVDRKVANDKIIMFENVPSNSLLLLMNLSRGVQERIFTYINNSQRFW